MQCCYIFMASPSPSSMCCSHTAWWQWRLSPKYRKNLCSGVLSSHGFLCKTISHSWSRRCVKLTRFQPWKSDLVHQSLHIFWPITGWVTSWLHWADSWAFISWLIEGGEPKKPEVQTVGLFLNLRGTISSSLEQIWGPMLPLWFRCGPSKG